MQMSPKQVGKVLSISDRQVAGIVGTAAATVDGAKMFCIAQTTGGPLALTLPNPTDIADLVMLDVVNTGTAPFTMYGVLIPNKTFATFAWTGIQWVALAVNAPAGAAPGSAQTASTTFASPASPGTSWGAAGLTLNITTTGASSNVRVYLRAFVKTSPSSGDLLIGANIDGGTTTCFTSFNSNSGAGNLVNGEYLFTGVAPGTHTINIMVQNASSASGAFQGDSSRPLLLIAEEAHVGPSLAQSAAPSYLRAIGPGATSNTNNGTAIPYASVDVQIGNDISLNTSTGVFTLAANRTYRLRASPGYLNFTANTGYMCFRWYNVTSGGYIGSLMQVDTDNNTAAAAPSAGTGEAVITTTTTTQVQFNFVNGSGVSSYAGGASQCWAEVEEFATVLPNVSPPFTAATATAAGSGGGVPAPAAGQQDAHLAGDGTWDAVGRMSLVTLSGFSGTQTPSASSTVDIAEILELSPSGNGTIVSLPGPTSRKSRRLIVVNTSGNSLTLQQVLTNGNMNNNSWTLAAYTAIVAIWTPGLNNWMRVN